MIQKVDDFFKKYAAIVCERIGWIGAIFVVFGYYLNANQHATSWLFWVIGNSLIGFYSLNKKAYPTATMSFILVLINIYGYLKWVDK